MLLAIIYQLCLICFHMLPAIVAAWGVVLLLTGYAYGCTPKPRPRGAMVALQVGSFIVKGGYVVS